MEISAEILEEKLVEKIDFEKEVLEEKLLSTRSDLEGKIDTATNANSISIEALQTGFAESSEEAFASANPNSSSTVFIAVSH